VKGKHITVFLQFISGVIAINPLVAFYDIQGGKREVLFFYFVTDTTRDRCFGWNKLLKLCRRAATATSMSLNFASPTLG
jgi:hypothetical protein